MSECRLRVHYQFRDVCRTCNEARTNRFGGRRGCQPCSALVAFFVLTPTGCYLSRAGWEEAKILAGRRPIVRARATIRAPTPPTRAKLELVLAARAFACGFDQAAHRRQLHDVLAPRARHARARGLRRLPRPAASHKRGGSRSSGGVPYKGFFDFGDARIAPRRPRAREAIDTYVRPSAAFSTLGWFNDPVLSTTIDEDSINLANTVIHEVTHNTFYKRRGRPCSTNRSRTSSARAARRGSSGAWGFSCGGERATPTGRTTSAWARSGRRCTAASTRRTRCTLATPPGATRLARAGHRVRARRDSISRSESQPTLPATIRPSPVARIRIDNNAADVAPHLPHGPRALRSRLRAGEDDCVGSDRARHRDREGPLEGSVRRNASVRGVRERRSGATRQ